MAIARSRARLANGDACEALACIPGASRPSTSPIDVPDDHMALTRKTGASSAVSPATAGSVAPSLTAKSGTGAPLPTPGGPTADGKSALKAHRRRDLANLIKKIWVAYKRPSDG